MKTLVIIEADVRDEAQYSDLLAAARLGLSTFPREETGLKMHVAQAESAEAILLALSTGAPE